MADRLTMNSQDAFAQVKPVCVQLASYGPLHPSNAPAIHSSLTTLSSLLSSSPPISAALHAKPSFCAYVFFPLTKLLQVNSFDAFRRHSHVLASLLDCIAHWAEPQPQLDPNTAEQLWLVCSLIVGGPLDNSSSSSSTAEYKADDWNELVRLHAVRLTCLLLERKAPNVSHTLMAHTMSALLSPAAAFDPPSRVQSLRTLSALVFTHSQFKRDGLDVQFLPGLVSGLLKILLPHHHHPSTTAKQAHSTVVVAALELLGDVLVRVAGNEVCQGILSEPTRIDRLEDLATQADVPHPKSTIEGGGAGRRTSDGLEQTAHQVHLAFLALLPTYRRLDHPESKLAYAHFCLSLLHHADRTLHSETVQLLRMEVCAMAVDEWPQVQQAVSEQAGGRGWTAKDVRPLQDILSQALLRLSNDIQRHGDDPDKLGWSLSVLRGSALTLLRLTKKSKFRAISNHNAGLASDSWALGLLRAVEFARLPGMHDPSAAAGDAAAKAWIAPPPTLLSVNDSNSEIGSWPALGMKRLPSMELQGRLAEAIRMLGQLYVEMGQVDVVEQFLDLATGGLEPSLRAAAWWIVSLLVPCLSSTSTESVKLVRRIVAHVSDPDSGRHPSKGDTRDDEPEGGALVERVKGLQVESLLSNYNVDNASSKAESAARARTSAELVCTCTSLRALAACSQVLETDFRAQLLHCLYPILAHLGSTTHALVREHAEVALQHIAFYAGYASTVNLVLDNVDYIINAVSQRLLLTKLDPRAPSVLVAVVRLVGAPVVPMLADIVDDIFDALDNYHGYTTLCASLLAVLDALVKSIAQDQQGQVRPKPEPVYDAPDPARDLAKLQDWISNRRKAAVDPPEEEADPFHGQPSEEAFRRVSEQLKSEAPKNEDQPNPPTKAQATCSAILSKSLYFLSHSSSFLRARVLGLVSSAVTVLGSQSRESDLLPFINRAWPLLLNRLSMDEELYVVAETAGLIKELAAQVGDYMCRKILDDAWPKFQQLMQQQAVRDSHSKLTAQSKHTASHRLLESVFEAMRHVAEEVPLRDGIDWDIAMGLRKALVTTRDTSLQGVAAQFYRSLGRVRPEVVWLALHGATADVAGLPKFLYEEQHLHVQTVLVSLEPGSV